MTEHAFLRRLAFAAMLIVCGLQPQLALSQVLPWQSGGQPQSQPQQGQGQPPQHRHHQNVNKPPNHTHANSTRKQDDRKLDTLATRFYGIHEKDKDAALKLEKLEKEVSGFHASLKQRSYDAGDIMKDAGNLRARIARQRKEWEAKAAAEAPAVPPAPPAPPAPAAMSTVAPVATPVPPSPVAPAATR